jgi:hypothetical protein
MLYVCVTCFDTHSKHVDDSRDFSCRYIDSDYCTMGFFPEQVQALCRGSRPTRIDELWERQQLSSHSNNTAMCTEHLLADHLDLWASSNEISDLLLDNDRLQNLVNQLYESSVFIGQFCQARPSSESPLVLVVASCDQCNTPYDLGSCQHPNSPPRTTLIEPQVSVHVHLTVITLSIIANLLTKSNADKLVLLLTRERPGSVITQTQLMEWLQEGLVSKKPYVLPALVGLIDNCSNAFPKAGQLAAGVVSLIICRRPAVALAMLDADMFITSATQYLEKVFMLVHNSECAVEQYFGITAFLNIARSLSFGQLDGTARALTARVSGATHHHCH